MQEIQGDAPTSLMIAWENVIRERDAERESPMGSAGRVDGAIVQHSSDAAGLPIGLLSTAAFCGALGCWAAICCSTRPGCSTCQTVTAASISCWPSAFATEMR
jgi:hypothetical protein